jgi:NAD(P)-dependent dehydrogenase (short-subunit alcohol dehydrogenase family)
MRLLDKVIVITGGGSGLGRECALLFAEHGARVVVTDLLADRAEAVAALVTERGGQAVARKMDVRIEDEVAATVDETIARFGRLDVMFANAGVRVPRPEGGPHVAFENLTVEDWDEVNSTNLFGAFLSCKHAVRVMKPRGQGNILLTSSAAGLVGYPEMGIYSASKGGVNGLVKSLSFEVGAYGIRVNSICPTHGMSPNFLLPKGAPVVGRSYEEVAGPWDPQRSPIPLKLNRPPTLLDNANAALFLVSDESAYISGVCLPTTDGGTLSRVAMFFESNWVEELVGE